MLNSPRRVARQNPAPRRKPLPRPGKRAAITGSVVVACIVAATVALTRPSSQPAPGHVVPAARAQAYSAYTACLLTGGDGLADPVAGPVWAGMQATSNTTHAQVSYLAMLGPASTHNADAYINTLALRGCSIVLAAGSVPAEGAIERAAAWPHLTVVAVVPATGAHGQASTPSPAAKNLTVLVDTSAKALQTQIDTLLTTASRNAVTPSA